LNINHIDILIYCKDSIHHVLYQTWHVDITAPLLPILLTPYCVTVNSLLSMWTTVFITFFTKQFFSDKCWTFLSPT